jgi:hypothetical protein
LWLIIQPSRLSCTWTRREPYRTRVSQISLILYSHYARPHTELLTVPIVFKMPEAAHFGRVGITMGTNPLAQPFFDVNRPITDTVLFRMTGECSVSEGDVDVVETERYDIDPTLRLTDNDATTLTLQGRFSCSEQPEYQGLPATGAVARDFRIGRDLFIGPEDIEDSFAETASATATLTHRFDATWSARAISRHSASEFEENVQTIFGGDGFVAEAPFIDPSTSCFASAEAPKLGSCCSSNSSANAKETKPPPCAGAVFDVTDALTLFASCGEGSRGQLILEVVIPPQWASVTSPPVASVCELRRADRPRTAQQRAHVAERRPAEADARQPRKGRERPADGVVDRVIREGEGRDGFLRPPRLRTTARRAGEGRAHERDVLPDRSERPWPPAWGRIRDGVGRDRCGGDGRRRGEERSAIAGFLRIDGTASPAIPKKWRVP